MKSTNLELWSTAVRWRIAGITLAFGISTSAALIPNTAIIIGSALLLFALSFLRLKILVVLLISASLASRFSFSVASASIRPEHLATIALVIAVVVQGKGKLFIRTATQPPNLYLLAYIAYSTLISLILSESFVRSATVLSWLLLDWLLLAALVSSGVSRHVIYGTLAAGSAVISGMALILWSIALSTGGSLGVQRDAIGSVPAVYAFSYEANILAGYLMLSALALIAIPCCNRRRGYGLAAWLSIVAIPTTQTRAAVVGLSIGLAMLWLFSPDRATRARVRRIFIVISTVWLSVMVLPRPAFLEPLFGKFGGLVDVGSQTGVYRIHIAQLALGDLKDVRSWFFGLGTNTFPQRHLDPSRPGEGVEAYLSSLQLQLLYDSGLIGILLISILAIHLLRRARYSATALSLTVAFAVATTSTSAFWFATTWIFAALALLPSPSGEADKDNHVSADRTNHLGGSNACPQSLATALSTPRTVSAERSQENRST